MKKLRHLLEALIVFPLYLVLKLIPMDISSALVGRMAVIIGPFLRVSQIAQKNLKLIFPEKTELDIAEIINGVWNNLGRMVAELPHINSLDDKEFKRRVKIINPPNKNLKSALFLSGHYGNFEMAARIFKAVDVKINLIYRPANNRIVDWLINSQRAKSGASLIPKGNAGVRMVLEALDREECIGLMIDQKTNTGIDVPFMGQNAKTTQLPANLASKYELPIYFMRMARREGAYFEVEFSDPIMYKKSQKPHEIMEDMASRIGEWIKKDPKQWFWVHKRWGKL